MKRRRKTQLAGLLAVAAVILLVYGYIRFFNGSVVYISTGLGKNELFKIDKEVTKMAEATLLLSDARTEYESLFGSEIWTQTIDGISFDDYVKEQVKVKLIRIRCMNLMAQEKGVALSRTQKDAVSDAADVYWEGLGESQQKELGLAKEDVTQLFMEFAVAKALYEDMTGNVTTEVSADEARVITIQYICADSEEQITAAKQRLDAGEIFYVVARDFNGEEYECELRRGQMEEAFEKAAFDLRTGETSQIVEAAGKFYIIKCSSDNEKSKTEANKTELIEKHKLDVFNAAFESYEAKQYVELNDKVWDTVKMAEVTKLPVNFEEIYNRFLK